MAENHLITMKPEKLGSCVPQIGIVCDLENNRLCTFSSAHVDPGHNLFSGKRHCETFVQCALAQIQSVFVEPQGGRTHGPATLENRQASVRTNRIPVPLEFWPLQEFAGVLRRFLAAREEQLPLYELISASPLLSFTDARLQISGQYIQVLSSTCSRMNVSPGRTSCLAACSAS